MMIAMDISFAKKKTVVKIMFDEGLERKPVNGQHGSLF